LPPTSKVVSPAEAARVLEATGLKRDIDPRTLAWRLTMAARGYWLWAGLKRPGGQVQALAAKMLATASDLLELLEAEEVEAVIPPPPPADVLAGRWLVTRLRDVLEELAEQAQEGEVSKLEPVPLAGIPGLITVPDEETVLVVWILPALFKELFAPVRKGEAPGGARDRFIISAANVMGFGGRTPDAVRKAISRWNTFRRQQHALQGGQSRG
jgi:hypothetical protein